MSLIDEPIEVRVWVPSDNVNVHNWYQESITLTGEEMEKLSIKDVGLKCVELSKAAAMKTPSKNIDEFKVVNLLHLQQTGELSTLMLAEMPIWKACQTIESLKPSNRILASCHDNGTERTLAQACQFFGQRLNALEEFIVIIGFNKQRETQESESLTESEAKNDEHLTYKLYNTTPHDLHVYGDDTIGRGDEVTTIKKNENLQLRVPTQKPEVVDCVSGKDEAGEIMLCRRTSYKNFSDNDMKRIRTMNAEDSAIIASGITADQLMKVEPPLQCKILVPATGPHSVVRDDKGRIIGVRFLEDYTHGRDGERIKRRKKE